MIQYDRAYAIGEQQASDDLSEPAKACDDDFAFLINYVCLTFVLRLVGDYLVVNQQQQRRRGH